MQSGLRLELHQWSAAEADCNESLKLKRDNPKALFQRAVAMKGLQKFHAALEDVKDVLPKLELSQEAAAMKLKEELESKIRAMRASTKPMSPPIARFMEIGEVEDQKFAAVSCQDARKILRMSQKGMTISQIADVWELSPENVVGIMAQAGYEEGLAPTVKRLTKDPDELCCSISGTLFEHPVVAEDGSTYSKKGIEQWLAEQARNRRPPTSPLTGRPLTAPVQLNPSQDMVSRVLSFKQETVREALLVASFLWKTQTFEAFKQLLNRAETFVRQDLGRNASASSRKHLFKLLVLRMRMPHMAGAAEWAICNLLEDVADSQLEGLLSQIPGSDLGTWLDKLPYQVLERLCNSAGAYRDWISRPLARRYASDLQDNQWFKKLWQLLFQNAGKDDQWAEGAAVVLVAFLPRVDTPLQDLARQTLCYALQFLLDKERATCFALGFFKHDLGISDVKNWPPTSSARILEELASRSTGQTRLQLLVRGHSTFPSDANIQKELLSDLRSKILQADDPSASSHSAFDQEQDLLVRLAVEE